MNHPFSSDKEDERKGIQFAFPHDSAKEENSPFIPPSLLKKRGPFTMPDFLLFLTGSKYAQFPIFKKKSVHKNYVFLLSNPG